MTRASLVGGCRVLLIAAAVANPACNRAEEPDKVVERLVALAKSGKPQERRDAVTKLKAIGGRASLQLGTLLEERRQTCRRDAAGAVARHAERLAQYRDTALDLSRRSDLRAMRDVFGANRRLGVDVPNETAVAWFPGPPSPGTKEEVTAISACVEAGELGSLYESATNALVAYFYSPGRVTSEDSLVLYRFVVSAPYPGMVNGWRLGQPANGRPDPRSPGIRLPSNFALSSRTVTNEVIQSLTFVDQNVIVKARPLP